VRLIETFGIEGPYTCLSHCWGNSEHLPLRTLEGGHKIKDEEGNFTGQYVPRNLDKHMDEIPFKHLPATFRDAVLFLRISRVARYVWIDSLCIIQESKEDWGREAVKMAGIYQNSLLTLAATKSRDSTGGLFSKSDPKYDTRTFSVAYTDDETYTVCWRRARPHWFGCLDREEHQPAPLLLSRAWVYQERLLSPQTLHVELLWECRQESTCECGLWIRSPKQCLRFDSIERVKGWSGVHHSFTSEKTSTIEGRWRSAIMEYSRLNLTNTNDRLPAIAGIAKQAQ
ncbi:heterokaryon incompatibility protein-domain-containing protein, partial [Phyllosticta citrichinensis]